MKKSSTKKIAFLVITSCMLFVTPKAQSQFLKKVVNTVKSLSEKSKSSNSQTNKVVSNKVTNKKNTTDKVVSNKSVNNKSKRSKELEGFVTRNKIGSRFVKESSSFTMSEIKEKMNGYNHKVLVFDKNAKTLFKLYPRFAYDDYGRGKDGVYSDLFVNPEEGVYHVHELQTVIDTNGEKHSFSLMPSMSKRVLKTPDNVFILYNFGGGKKIGQKYPYYASSKSNITGPFVIAAPSLEKFDEWSGEKAKSYVKDFERRLKIGCFKFMPKKGKLHTSQLEAQCKKAIYKKLRKYSSNVNLEIRRLSVYSDVWEEKTDPVTDEVIAKQLVVYYLYVNGEETDINAAKINQQNNQLTIEKLYSDKFSKNIPVSIVNRYFKK